MGQFLSIEKLGRHLNLMFLGTIELPAPDMSRKKVYVSFPLNAIRIAFLRLLITPVIGIQETDSQKMMVEPTQLATTSQLSSTSCSTPSSTVRACNSACTMRINSLTSSAPEYSETRDM